MEQLPIELIRILNDTKNTSKAKKRKVAAIIFDAETYQPYTIGINHNLFVDTPCEDNNNETLDTVIHAEQDVIFSFLKHMYQQDARKGFNMLVSYSPCIECVKQIILLGIKNVYIMEEHAVNFVKPQFNKNSLSPLETLLQAGIKVFKCVDTNGVFKQIISVKSKALIYHSKDLDGFMSRYLFETYYDTNMEYEYYGYNYEPDAKWMHQGFKEIVFIDVTPPKEWLDTTTSVVSIFDHHFNAFKEKTADLSIHLESNFNSYLYYEFVNKSNVRIGYFITKSFSDVSACKLFYLNALASINHEPLSTYVNYISLYDTWTFIDNKNSDDILNLIEALKPLKYEEFKQLMDSELHDKESMLDELIAKGCIIRQLEKSKINKALETALVIDIKGKFENSAKYQHLKLVICQQYPNYELEIILRNKFENTPIIFIGYSINTVEAYISYSVRYYPTEEETLIDAVGINALNIAKIFGGGGHVNAAGFRTSLYDGYHLMESKYSTIIDSINRRINSVQVSGNEIK